VATLKQKKDLAYDRLPGRSHRTANPPTLVRNKKEKTNKKQKPELKNQKKMTNPASSPFHGRQHSRRNYLRVEGKSDVRHSLSDET